MSKQKRKLLATATPATPEKTRQEQSLVQLEGKLTEAQLEAIAGGGCGSVGCGGNHNETMVSSAQLNFEGETDVYTKA